MRRHGPQHGEAGGGAAGAGCAGQHGDQQLQAGHPQVLPAVRGSGGGRARGPALHQGGLKLCDHGDGEGPY